MNTLAKHFQIVPIASIEPYEGNSRKHSARQIDKIAASIAEFGFNAPILIDGQNQIVAGHGRYLAAKKLGLAEVPTIQLGHLSEAKRRAYVIADNRIAEDASWDLTKLAIEAQALQLEGFDLAATGLDDVDFSRIDMELRRMTADLELIDEPPQAYQQPSSASQDDLGVDESGQVSPPQHVAPGIQRPAAAPALPALTAQPVPFNVLLLPGQRDAVLSRLNAIKAEHQLKTLGEALAVLCQPAQ